MSYSARDLSLPVGATIAKILCCAPSAVLVVGNGVNLAVIVVAEEDVNLDRAVDAYEWARSSRLGFVRELFITSRAKRDAAPAVAKLGGVRALLRYLLVEV